MMFVSIRPCWWRSLVIAAGLVVVGCGVLVGAESRKAGSSGAAGHGGELLPGDEAAALPQWDQLADLVAVAGDGERLPAFDGVHDLLGPVAQIALGDLRL